MANQGADRRTVLEMLAKAAIASQFPGFSRWVFAQQQGTVDRAAHYQPRHFSPAEFHTIDILTGLIIPADQTPGAREAGVAEFIDFLASHGEEDLRQPMRDGLKWLDGAAGGSFAGLPSGQQVEILQRAASGGEPGQSFFRLIRRYTVMGYYTSRVGLAELDYPGLRFYTESPACPHTSDPEHRHLPPPKV